MNRLVVVLFLFILFISPTLALNPKQIISAEYRIIQSGTLRADGDISYANLTLFIPQEGIESIDANTDWKYIYDEFGNKLVLLEWEDFAGSVNYNLEIIVRNDAKYLTEEKNIGYDEKYLKENEQITFTPELREISYPYERSLEKVIELTTFVNEYISYDKSLVKKMKSSNWVFANKKGVCVEYANLLSSLLRISGIPTRYIVGYAFSTVDEKLIGHTWIEVLADNAWVSVDPTWLEIGYLDATHIKTSVRENASQTEILNYKGQGEISWDRKNEKIELLDYELRNMTEISLATRDFSFGEFGYIKATVRSDSCTISSINVSSCVNNDSKMFDIFDKERNVWVCKDEELYWFFRISDLDENYIYTCPVTVYDQAGNVESKNIKISGKKKIKDISITGPDTAAINEQFTLNAEADNFIFYSPSFGEHNSKTWDLSLKSGNYKFYLYSDGALAEKEVSVTKEKEFAVRVENQRNVTLNGSFIIKSEIRNLLNKNMKVNVVLNFDDQTIEKNMNFSPNELKSIEFNVTAETPGNKKITVSALSDTLTSYSSSIYVYEELKEKGSLDSFLDAISGFFSGIIEWFASLFG